jgi:hypothetical protein
MHNAGRVAEDKRKPNKITEQYLGGAGVAHGVEAHVGTTKRGKLLMRSQ